ncbi:M15 family metallopeptidase [Candidatus Merdisoma sp. JLR.KK011]|uniref:M15 family metallopeptidase n=1 Tax=Candidatus Merdisoma sp. JLR.KK011 TaxID=3114299 RepID=UPI002FEF943B
MKGNSIKMVISVIGMAICLLCSCRQDKNEAKTESRQEQEAGLENAGSENMGLEDAGLEEPEEEEPDYRTCMSGTVVEQELTGEEISSLFYAQEIPQEVFARMDGVSYVENEDIALADLRYLRLLYVGFDEQTHVGELIVHASIADTILEIFQTLYENGYQIEKMRLIDDYGGDDHASLLDNNTSAFNYRVVEGSKKLSRHAYGLAIDINPFYNPYVTYPGGVEHISPEGSEPYADREADFPHKIGKDGDLCWQLFSQHGFTWGGDWKSLKDYQHFQISE